MNRTRLTLLSALLLVGGLTAQTQEPKTADKRSFAEAAGSVQQQLEESLAELARVREQMAAETIPLSRELNELQAELGRVELELQEATRQQNARSLELTNLRGDIKRQQDLVTYLEGLFNDYAPKFEASLPISELARYAEPLDAARQAREDPKLAKEEFFQAQTALVAASLERLHDAVGGTRFAGRAVDPDGMLVDGTFVQVGPAAVFRSQDGRVVGAAEQRFSLEAVVTPFVKPEDAAAAARLIETGSGTMPIDPTLGNANKLEGTQETLLQEVEHGGPVMWPIFALAAAALLVALGKWLGLMFVRKPSTRRVRALLDAVAARDEDRAHDCAANLAGPTGRMLRAGVEHLREPRELIEEVMYETVLTTRLRLQRFLPFIGIAAASAPLLGLLGTVTGIISTFKLITVYGSGDVKMLSSGISEALITTKFGLIVAIPSLLLHAYLTRIARGIVGQMETTAVAFVNQVSKTPLRPTASARMDDAAPAGYAVPDQELVRDQVREILGEMLGPLTNGSGDELLPAATIARPSQRESGWSGSGAAATRSGTSVGAPQGAQRE